MEHAENNVVRDAVRLATQMKNAIMPGSNWLVATIAKSKEEVFLAPDNIESNAFGYFYDQVLQLLEHEGVILEKEEWDWFSGIAKAKDYEKIKDKAAAKKIGYEVPNKITRYAWAHAYLPKNKEIDLWIVKDRDVYTATIITTKEKLSTFINKYTNLLPIFDEKTGELSFLHQKVLFEGRARVATVKLFVDELNSVIPLQTLYDIPRPKAQQQEHVGHQKKIPYERQGKKENANNAIDEMCGEIRKVLGQNRILKDTLRILYDKGVGFGLFVDENQLKSYMEAH